MVRSYGKAMVAAVLAAIGIILAAPAAPAAAPQTPQEITDAAVDAMTAAYVATASRVSNIYVDAREALTGENSGDIPAAKRCKMMGDAFAAITKECAACQSQLSRIVTNAETRLGRIHADSSYVVAAFDTYGTLQGQLNVLRTLHQDTLYTDLGEAFGFLP